MSPRPPPLVPSLLTATPSTNYPKAPTEICYSFNYSGKIQTTQALNTNISSVTTAAVAIQTMPSILGFDVSDSPSLPSSSSASSTDSPTAQSTGAVTTAESNNSKSGLSTGAIIGIAVGSAVFLILTALAAVFCRRHRRQQSNAKASRSDVQVMQDMLAEKTARSTVDVDTSYSEDARSHRPLYRGLGMSGVNHSSASMSLAGEGPVGRTTRSVSSIRRDSAAYTSLRNPPPIGTAVSIENGAGESPTTATHPESSTSGSPIGCSSTHQDRKFNPFPEAASSEHQEQHHYARGRTVSQKNSMSNLSNVLQVDHDLEPPSAVSGDILFEGHSIPGSAAGTPQLGPARFNVRSETPGGVSISEQYAHLVEDGMTEDEIRRLEEEERALDEAIEQHRAESRATTGG
ncbi:hypothetical protein BD289DRAFT_90114 [Coniella lustricola]|uniref:Uncharacterized protein n=1 Tax=Coniella lustricola TaxID=2025994 RepID=A0A2T3AGX7_9PEZI|nr:hypothetical protein BD289DRAFT_90114 [Coniella lustricola]